MKKYKYIILGAGPSGLTVAHSLVDKGVPLDQILVLEKESVAGGLCRSTNVDGAPLDIGGGHFLDVKKQKVLDFLFRFMPREEWKEYNRISKILLRDQEIDHPLEANLWQFCVSDQVDYLESIASAGCVRKEKMPESFVDWVYWKFGDRIASEYMVPYNSKIWSMELAELGTYWLYKLPDVSFRETLRSCLEGQAFGSLPAHGKFLYPEKFGYGEVWRRMGDALGDSLLTDCKVEKIDIDNLIVNDSWQAEKILTTIPWSVWNGISNVPSDIATQISSLEYTSIDVQYCSDIFNSPAHWIYEPDISVPHHRYLLRSNFVDGARGYWTETNSCRFEAGDSFFHHNEFSYPVNTIGKPTIVENVLNWAADCNIVGLGRWGKWEHMNSDVAVLEGLGMAEQELAHAG